MRILASPINTKHVVEVFPRQFVGLVDLIAEIPLITVVSGTGQGHAATPGQIGDRLDEADLVNLLNKLENIATGPASKAAVNLQLRIDAERRGSLGVKTDRGRISCVLVF